MLGLYENFPGSVHRIENYSSALSRMKLQQRLIRVIGDINRKTFSFEEIAIPTVPDCMIIFEFGVADAKSFNYIDDEEMRRTLNALKRKPFDVMDFFCAIRYYRVKAEHKTPLKFDYYMVRFEFNREAVSLQVFHERGPRYISPEDIISFISTAVNQTTRKKTLRTVRLD